MLGATVIVTEPEPEPPAPTVIQLAPLSVVHEQPVVVTETAAVPPVSVNASDVGVTV